MRVEKGHDNGVEDQGQVEKAPTESQEKLWEEQVQDRKARMWAHGSTRTLTRLCLSAGSC